jgi:acetyl-CoA synthetase
MPSSERFIWEPTPDFLRNSNVARLMRKLNIATYDDLLRRSVEDLDWFWRAVDEDLGFAWFRKYDKVLDSSRGIPWTTWFVGGRINIAHHCVDRHAAGPRANTLALIWEGEDGAIARLTYRDVARQVAQAANAFRRLGVRKGDVVGLYVPMVPEAIVAMMAICKIGAIYTPIFSGYAAEAAAKRLSDCGAKLIVTVDGFLRRGKEVPLKREADRAAALAPSVERVVVIERLGLDLTWDPARDVKWSEIVERESPRAPTEETDAEDPFLIIYTSGTTGRPKGSVHVHGGFLVKIAQEVAYQTDCRDGDILFWFTDMGWIMAPWEIVGTWALGGTLFAYEGAPDWPGPDRLWAMIERHGVSILGVSPTLVRALMKFGDEPVRKHDLSSLRLFGSTGEPWNPASYEWLFETVGGKRCPIINLSGGTEVGACFLSPHPVTPLKVCSLRGPALGMDVDVVDEQGRSLRGGAVGELVCRKPWPGMTRGLYKDPDRFLEVYWSRFKDVWLHGDWASVDEDGHWFLHGRSDDTIKIAGKRLGPAEVESALAGHPAVTESAAVGVPHELKGESVVCFVVLRPSHAPSEALREELKERVASQLGKALRPEAVKFVKLLPKTRNAKILRRVIRAKHLGKEDLGDLSNLENPDAIEEIARAV